MKLGNLYGCHQLASRSFFIKGYQFPVCSRCTGVFIGYIISFLFYKNLIPSVFFSFILCLIMFLDWYLQFLNLLQSTNFRRVITGVLGGWGVMNYIILTIMYFMRIL